MLISGGRIVDPVQGLDAIVDLRVLGERVAEFGERLQPERDERVIDATGAYVAPGFIDMHVHLRIPGNPEKETLETGTAAAAAGGFTAVAAMPNTQPAIDTAELVRALRLSPSIPHPDIFCRIYPIAAITKGRKGTGLLDYDALFEAGAVAFSDDGSTVMSAKVVRDAALAAATVPACFIVHCEDEDLKGNAVMSEGTVSRRLGLPGSPSVAEDVIVARDALIAAETGKRWHIAHVSTKESLGLVQTARESGVEITCEVTPHHLVFTDELVETHGSGAKVNPPLRTRTDVDALRRAVLAGEVDVFATDHAPHTTEEKTAALREGSVGFSGLEIAVGAYAYAVPELDVSRFVELLSVNPARILGVQGGTLKVGSAADITIFADRAWTVDPQRFRSKGKSTPFAGMRLPRRAVATIVGGVIVYDGLSHSIPQHDKV